MLVPLVLLYSMAIIINFDGHIHKREFDPKKSNIKSLVLVELFGLLCKPEPKYEYKLKILTVKEFQQMWRRIMESKVFIFLDRIYLIQGERS